MDNLGSYFPPMEKYTRNDTPQEVAPEPLLPTPSTEDTFLPIFDNNTPYLPTDTSEQLPIQSCSCSMSDACILETLALLYGSVCILDALVEYRGCAKSTISTISTGRYQVENSIKDLLPPLDRIDSGQGTTLETLLLKHTADVLGQDICQDVRHRVKDLDLDVVDTFAPIQHCAHVLLTLLGYESSEFCKYLEVMRESGRVANIALINQALDSLARSCVRVYPSQFEAKLETFRASIEELALHIEYGDCPEHEEAEVVECVAAEMRMSWSTPKLLSMPRTVAVTST